MKRSHYRSLSLLFLFALGTSALSQQAGVSPASLAFGNQAPNLTSASQTVTLTNLGTADLAVSSILASDNYHATSTCSPLAPGESCPIEVTYVSIGTLGTLAGQLTIFDNDPASPQVVQLSATTVSAYQLSPLTVDFGTVAVGTVSQPKPVTLTNNSGVAVQLSTLRIATSGNYSWTHKCPALLKSRASCTLEVVFAPTVGQAIPGTLSIDAANTPAIALSGSGSGGAIPQLSLQPGSVNFGSNVVVPLTCGGSLVSETVTATNTSSSTSLDIQSVKLAGPNFSYEIESNTCKKGMLAPSGTCKVVVGFCGSAVQSFSGTNAGAVTVTYSGSTNPSVAGLTAQIVPIVTFSPSSLTFAPQKVGTSSPAQIVTLTFAGGNFTFGGILISSTASGNYAVSGTNSSSSCTNLSNGAGAGGFDPGTQCTLAVTFTPSVSGVVAGTVSFNIYPLCAGEVPGPCDDAIVLNLKGTGQ